MQDQQPSPIETPTTPSTPNLPFFFSSSLNPSSFTATSSSSGSRSSSVAESTAAATAATSTMRRRTSSIVSIPSSPLDTTVTRPLPIRPHKVTKRPISPAPPAAHRPRSRSRSRSRGPPPNYYLRVATATATTTPGLRTVISHLQTPLVPLISVTTGLPHPSFPSSILQYHLLTHEQLDELARYYHQVTPPVRETFRYPARIPPWVCLEKKEEDEEGSDGKVDLETKRRRWGRFVGLRGCESPTTAGREGGVEDRMEKEWRRALERARDEERLRDKGWRGRW